MLAIYNMKKYVGECLGGECTCTRKSENAVALPLPARSQLISQRSRLLLELQKVSQSQLTLP